MKIRPIIAVFAIACCLFSCQSYNNVPYFQDLQDLSALPVLTTAHSVQRVDKGDKLNIVVSSGMTPDIALKYNLPLQSTRIGAVSTAASYNSNSTMPYQVDSNGDIDVPILGKVRVSGMTREEVEVCIKKLLVDQKLLNDAVVTCEILNHYVNVLGDVRNPGRILIEKDNLTIIQAISICGDLNITGERQNVMVIRNVNGEQKVYHVDFTCAESVYKSEAYYLQPDDVVYVNPNVMKQRTSTAMGNSWQTPSLYFSLVSVLLSMTTLIVSLVRR